MILVDANLLIYSHVPSFAQNPSASSWLNGKLNGTLQVGLPWPSLLAFVRIVSNPRLFYRPESVESAWGQVEEWLDCPPVWIPSPTERHREHLGNLIRSGANQSKLIHDAHLAALAIEHGLTLCSNDNGFARFPGLHWENPLA